jgi:hypothetical protein
MIRKAQTGELVLCLPTMSEIGEQLRLEGAEDWSIQNWNSSLNRALQSSATNAKTQRSQ